MRLLQYFLLLSTLTTFSQHLDPALLKDDTNGKHFFIRSYDINGDFGFYLLQSGNTTSDVEYDYLFSEYSVVTFFNKGKICLLEGINMDTSYRLVVNLDRKELIIPPTTASVEFNYQDEVFIVNPYDSDSSKIIDLNGKVLYSDPQWEIYNSSLGYYHKFSDTGTRFFDKTGKQINYFKNFSMNQEIDSNSFLGYKLMLVSGDSIDVSVIVDRKNQVVFSDKCQYGFMTTQRKNWTNEIEVIAVGFCGMDDSRTLVVKNEKNKWELVLEKSKLIGYCYYMTDISKGMLLESGTQTINKKKPKYFITGDELSYILDAKGKIIFTLYAQTRIDDIWIRDNFIVGYLFQNPGQFWLIDYNGDFIIQDQLSEEIYLHDDAMKEGYYAFYSKLSNHYYILKSSTMEVYNSSEPIPTISSLEDLKKWFPE